MTILDDILSIQRGRDYWDDGDLDTEEFNSKYDVIDAIIKRYFQLQDRYLHQNEKHFGELLTQYFEDFPITNTIDGD